MVYVAPSGGRAASAGVFITLAANIAAMAPTTHIGAAHPVHMQGKMDKTMEKKVVNDLAAMIRGIAEKRGRNAKWAEEAVRKSVSITETEALKNKVIDLIAPDIPSLLKAIDGRTVDLVIGKKTLKTADARGARKSKWASAYKLLGIISNPNIAYILMILGFYGLYFELSNPGAIFPGVAGAICLILAFYALHTLPINYAGLMLIILAIGLFIAEAFITSHGVLGVGGTIAMLIGSVMLIESPSPVSADIMGRDRPRRGPVGAPVHHHRTLSRSGCTGEDRYGQGRNDRACRRRQRPKSIARGQVFVRGEYWTAWSDEPDSERRAGDRRSCIDGLTAHT